MDQRWYLQRQLSISMFSAVLSAGECSADWQWYHLGPAAGGKPLRRQSAGLAARSVKVNKMAHHCYMGGICGSGLKLCHGKV